MKKFLLSFLLILGIAPAFAQRFSQYYTGTLYDSFENPAQRAFIPDSSRQLASNFLFPNFSFNGLLTGNSQAAFIHRLFAYNYNVRDSSRFLLKNAKNNHILTNTNTYWAMLKIFTSFNGDQEMGFSIQTRGEGRGVFSDQSVGLVSGLTKFNNTTYNDIFNDKLYYQLYHQLSFTYRERVTKQFSMGVKLSALLGISYENLMIDRSRISFDNESEATLAMAGQFYKSYTPGSGVGGRNLLPTFRNPGASISIGTMLRTRDGFILQWNVKDLGFIHWSSRSQVYNFANSQPLTYNNFYPEGGVREDTTYNTLKRIIQSNPTTGSFTTHTDGRAEFSAARTFYVTDDKYVKYTPALILSKQIFDHGMEGALVNHIQYHNAILTLTGAYNDLKKFTFGMQFMIKSPNTEIFIGTEALQQTILTAQQMGRNEDAINRNSPFSAASIYMGFSLKFGNWIEHPLNASIIPTGEKGFFGRLYSRLFKSDR